MLLILLVLWIKGYLPLILQLSFLLKIYDDFSPLWLTAEVTFLKAYNVLTERDSFFMSEQGLRKALRVTSEGERWNKSLGSLRSSQEAMALRFLPIALERDVWFVQSSRFIPPGRIILSFPLGRWFIEGSSFLGLDRKISLATWWCLFPL